MRVWHVSQEIECGDAVKIEGGDARHIATVLRYRAGDMIRIGDLKSHLFSARIESVKKNLVTAKIVQRVKAFPPGKPEVILALSICKQAVMELVVQKAVELDCAGFWPVATMRSPENVTGAKLERLKKIAREASKQCGRLSSMEVGQPVAPDGLPDADFKLVLWEEEKKRAVKSVLSAGKPPDKVLLFVGPAGGFQKEEMENFAKLNFVPAGMGGLILRSETAAISLMAVVNYHFGKFGKLL